MLLNNFKPYRFAPRIKNETEQAYHKIYLVYAWQKIKACKCKHRYKKWLDAIRCQFVSNTTWRKYQLKVITSSYLTCEGEFWVHSIHLPTWQWFCPSWCIPWNVPILCQVFKFLDIHWTSHFPFGIQTFLVLFILEMISFGTQKRLTPLLGCLFTLMATTLSFFFFL